MQEVSGSLVTAANSASGLAVFMIAKRREGVLSHFLSHVGSHFKRYLASSSFCGPHVFDDEVLARVIAASREDSHLDAQLSIAKAFTLTVFRAEAKNPGRKASSARVFLPLLPLPQVFGERAGGRSGRLLLRVAPEARSHLIVALPLLPSGEEGASEARDLAQR